MPKCGYCPMMVLKWIPAGEQDIATKFTLYNADGSIHYVTLPKNVAFRQLRES